MLDAAAPMQQRLRDHSFACWPAWPATHLTTVCRSLVASGDGTWHETGPALVLWLQSETERLLREPTRLLKAQA